MTWRSTSTFGSFIFGSFISSSFMKWHALLDRVLVNFPWRLFNQECNQDCFLSGLCAEVCGNRETAHPYNFVSAYDDGPESALGLRHVFFLKQFFNLLRRLRVRRKKPVSGTPVPHDQLCGQGVCSQKICTKKLLRIILRGLLGSDAQGFDDAARFEDKDAAGDRQSVFVVGDWILIPTQIGRDEDH